MQLCSQMNISFYTVADFIIVCFSAGKKEFEWNVCVGGNGGNSEKRAGGSDVDEALYWNM